MADAITLSRAAIKALRPHADAFAEVAMAGARGLAVHTGAGELEFRSPAVTEIYEDLAAALGEAIALPDKERIEQRSGTDFSRFVDRVVIGWLRAEPDITQFLLADRRGSGAFLFDILGAELHELGIQLEVEPRPFGCRVAPPPARRRVVAPVFACVWLGGFGGWLVQRTGKLADGAMYGFAVGLACGLVIAIRMLLKAVRPTCSECSADLDPGAATCPRCATTLVSDIASDEVPPDDEGQ